MKVNGLRIGNYVMYEPTIDDWEEKVITLHSLLQVDISPESYCGIPLTEEWLLKFGAKELKPKRGVLKEFVLKKVRIEMSNSGNFYYKNSKLILESIHQLQNLYFALTGEELELT